MTPSRILIFVAVCFFFFVSFCLAETDSIIVTEDGRVGMGNAAPRSKLDVHGSNPAEDAVVISKPAGTGHVLRVKDAETAAANDLVVIDGQGRVGIGTSQPTQTLSLNEDSGNVLMTFKYQDIYKGKIGYDAGIDKFVLGHSTSDDIVIDGSGKIGVGIIAPDVDFHIKQKADSYNGGLRLDNALGGNYWGLVHGGDDQFYLGFNSTLNVLAIKPDGNVGVGTNDAQYKLDVNGTIRGNNVSPSDERWKTNIAPLTGSLQNVSRLRGVSYEWIDDAKGAGSRIGVIAQEVEKVYPELVSTDNKGYKSVDYAKMVAPLIEAVKELNAALNAQKQLNEALQSRIESQETMNRQLIERVEAIEAMQ